MPGLQLPQQDASQSVIITAGSACNLAPGIRLSEYAKQHGIEVRNPEEWVGRPLEERRRKQEKNVRKTGTAGRPQNAFMLYRSVYQHILPLLDSQIKQNDVSKLVAESWHNEKLDNEFRKRFEKLSKTEKERHELAHGKQTYVPKKKNSAKGAKTLADGRRAANDRQARIPRKETASGSHDIPSRVEAPKARNLGYVVANESATDYHHLDHFAYPTEYPNALEGASPQEWHEVDGPPVDELHWLGSDGTPATSRLSTPQPGQAELYQPQFYSSPYQHFTSGGLYNPEGACVPQPSGTQSWCSPAMYAPYPIQQFQYPDPQSVYTQPMPVMQSNPMLPMAQQWDQGKPVYREGGDGSHQGSVNPSAILREDVTVPVFEDRHQQQMPEFGDAMPSDTLHGDAMASSYLADGWLHDEPLDPML